MAVNQLQMPAPVPTVQADFSFLSQIPDIIKQAQFKQDVQALAQQAQQSGQQPSLTDLGKLYLKHGKVEEFKGLAQLAQQQELQRSTIQHQRAQEGFQGRQVTLAEQQAAEKPQYMKDDNGNIVEIAPRGGGAKILNPSGSSAPANPYASPGKPPQEHEAKAGLFADRIGPAHQTITALEGLTQGKGGAAATIATNHLPEGLTGPALAAGEAMGLGGGDRLKLMNAQRTFINALLRRESGAAISAGEFASYGKEYFPAPGDPPEVLAQKRANRQAVAEGLMREAGKTYKPPAGYTGSTKAGGSSAVISQARDAIAKGADRNAVIERLKANGIDPSGL